MSTSKFSIKIAIHAVSFCAVIGAGAMEAHAEDLTQARWFAQSREKGVGRDVIAVLTRAGGPGNEAIVGRLTTKLKARGARFARSGRKEAGVEEVTVVGEQDSWSLRVERNGLAARFIDNEAYTKLSEKPARSVDKRIPSATIESQARRFIEAELAEAVVLGKADRLVALATSRLVDDGVSATGQARTPRVAANRVLFGREVDGVPVVGPNAKVSVVLDNEGNVLEYEYDWAQYRLNGKSERTLDLACGLERLSGLDAARFDKGNVKAKAVECGYFDTGSNGGDLHPACAVVYETTLPRPDGKPGEVAKHEDVVPMAETVTADGSWDAASRLVGRSDICGAQSKGSAAIIEQLRAAR